MKAIVGFVVMVVLTVGGAVALLVWFSGMTAIQATDSEPVPDSPPAPAEVVRQGAVLVVQGEVQTVHDPEWTTGDGSRPNTPWELSDVPDEDWIQTPVTVGLETEPLITRPDVADAVGFDEDAGEITVAVRGGQIGDDVYEIDDGQDREFAAGDRVLLALTVAGSDVGAPELMSTTHGPGWELMRRYTVDGDTAVLDWGDETYERPVDDLLADFRDARP